AALPPRGVPALVQLPPQSAAQPGRLLHHDDFQAVASGLQRRGHPRGTAPDDADISAHGTGPRSPARPTAAMMAGERRRAAPPAYRRARARDRRAGWAPRPP